MVIRIPGDPASVEAARAACPDARRPRWRSASASSPGFGGAPQQRLDAARASSGVIGAGDWVLGRFRDGLPERAPPWPVPRPLWPWRALADGLSADLALA